MTVWERAEVQAPQAVSETHALLGQPTSSSIISGNKGDTVQVPQVTAQRAGEGEEG